MNYYNISEKDLGMKSKIEIVKMQSSDEVFNAIADIMVNTIEENNAKNKTTVFICPVGPIGQYNLFVKKVNEKRLSLKNCYFINMDEYLNDNDEWIDINNSLSFRGFMQKNVYDKIDKDLLMPQSQRIFPDPKNLDYIPKKIEELGGVDIAFGGIGINGHLAFNEPMNIPTDEFKKLKTRVLDIDPQTIATNAAEALCGAIEIFPKRCVSIGINEILSAKRIVLGVFRVWHRGVVRRAAYGEISASFPATLVQEHKNAQILVNDVAAKCPLE